MTAVLLQSPVPCQVLAPLLATLDAMARMKSQAPCPTYSCMLWGMYSICQWRGSGMEGRVQKCRAAFGVEDIAAAYDTCVGPCSRNVVSHPSGLRRRIQPHTEEHVWDRTRANNTRRAWCWHESGLSVG